VPSLVVPRSAGLGRLRQIDDIVTVGGKCFRIRGFDPIGVDAPCVYLEDMEQGGR
jgi:hypothetical protein